jgi:hypothetical protein
MTLLALHLQGLFDSHTCPTVKVWERCGSAVDGLRRRQTADCRAERFDVNEKGKAYGA